MRRLLEANLEKLGLELQIAASGHRGLQLANHSKPDLILLDSDMPDMLLSDLLKHLEAHLPEQVSVIVLSAEPLGRSLERNGRLIRYLVKPFAVPALLRLVDTALES
jgi:CheY-like chemotaxis protein